MNPSDQKPETASKRLAAYVRLTNEEHERLERDAKLSGLTVPELLKKVYFTQKPVVLLMSTEDLRRLMAQLGRIGNNINQVARALNSGYQDGFHDEIADVQRTFNLLMTFLTSRFKLLERS